MKSDTTKTTKWQSVADNVVMKYNVAKTTNDDDDENENK
jgi:hypothetical protein